VNAPVTDDNDAAAADDDDDNDEDYLPGKFSLIHM